MKEALEGTIPPEAQVVFNITGPAKNIYPVKLKNVTALEALFNLINIYGGEIKRDNYKIEIVETLGESKGVTVRYGKNIKGLRAIIDTNEFATKIYPIGENNLILPERYIEADSSITDILPYPIIKKVEFSNCNDVDKLRDLGNEYIKKVSNPFVNISVDFLELSKTKDYSEYENFFKLELGDIVTIKHEKLGIYSELRVIKTVKDLLRPINTKIELGSPLSTIVSKLDFTSMVERLESKIEGSQNAVILKRNSEDIIITSTSFYQAIAVGISALADTNLSCSLIINGSASSDLILYMKFLLDGQYYEFQPSQNLAAGENIINLTIPIPQVTAGSHSFIVELKTSTGRFNIEKNNLQVMIEGRHLEGGLNPSLPRAEILQFILYDFYLNKLNTYKDNMNINLIIDKIQDTNVLSSELIDYDEAINKTPSNIATNIDISMNITGISQIANNDFYLNLITDRWVVHLNEFINIEDGTWEEVNFVTLTEITDTLISQEYTSLGSGLVYEIEFSKKDTYNKLLDLNLIFDNE